MNNLLKIVIINIVLIIILSAGLYFYFDKNNNYELKQLSNANTLLSQRKLELIRVNLLPKIIDIDLLTNIKQVKKFFRVYPSQVLEVHKLKKSYRGMQYSVNGNSINVLLSIYHILKQAEIKINVDKLLFKDNNVIAQLTVLGD